MAALCDPLRERAETRAREWGITPKIYTRFEEVLDDPNIDAIELLTPTPIHAGQVVAALDAGKHVSCQKPICNTLDELETMAAAVARAKTMFPRDGEPAPLPAARQGEGAAASRHHRGAVGRAVPRHQGQGHHRQGDNHRAGL